MRSFSPVQPKTQLQSSLPEALFLNPAANQEDELHEIATTDGSIINSSASATAVALGLGIIINGFYIGMDVETNSCALTI
ncbi:MAG: hypothetical protein LPJ89_00120 [Hymenobacteraceae bacterium]|nr:hypothetical protein [Hymenobacteraceae bacterium]MDX5394636.1 hypothetical protein [Hymenobacteraceae bacterium]MDX5442169.1 hypothetical protein [Hymenobacteraceae bacterium]MDX5510667.1 hypothetical protein [Hymenobacteraceae bacterium]